MKRWLRRLTRAFRPLVRAVMFVTGQTARIVRRRKRWLALVERDLARAGDFADLSREFKAILVLMLDHGEDPVGARGAVLRLRSLFPNSRITLVCGSKNLFIANLFKLGDEIVAFDFFNVRTGRRAASRPDLYDRFAALIGDTYDLAVDLRVEDDTRFLLGAARSALKCGIGARWRLPFLDIILPGPEELDERAVGTTMTRIGTQHFKTRTAQLHPFVYSIDLSSPQPHAVYGPYAKLASGSYGVTFWFAVEGLGDQTIESPIIFEIVGDQETLLKERVDDRGLLSSGHFSLRFDNDFPDQRCEFRIDVPRRCFDGVLRFHGVSLERVGQHKQEALDRVDYLWLLTELISSRLGAAHAGQSRHLPDNVA